MSENSRTKNAKRNIYSGIIKQLTQIILPFITRTVLLYTLGVQYQGLSSLFTSILQVLNLTDLGFSSAVIYVLYKPITENDNEAICAIVNFLKVVYRYVGFIILGVGLILSFFLPSLISGDYPKDINIYILFYIYLFNAVISYWLFAYKSALLTAMQREDLVSNVYSVTSTIIKLVQLIILLIVPNYYLYILVVPVSTIANNLLLQYYSVKHFPKVIPQGKLSIDTKNTLKKQMSGIIVNRIGDVARNGFDNIFLSVILGLTVVAVYSNYYYVYSALYGLTLTISRAVQASVGNSIAKESRDKNYKDLLKFNFIYSWFTGWCTVCMCCLYQPFMNIWMKGNPDMLLSNFNMVLFCIYFYAINMNNVRNLYISGAGLFWELRVWYIAEAIGNIALNWCLGYWLGVSGILLATIITIFGFNFITRTNVLFKEYFKRSTREFYKKNLYYFIVLCIATGITYFVSEMIPFYGFVGLIIKGIICIVIPNVVFVLLFIKTEEFNDGMVLIKSLISKR